MAAAEITRQDLEDLPTPPSHTASISNVKQISSYNWIEAPEDIPTIAVPGSPPLWSPPRPSPSRPLKKDSGLIYIAQNAARHPDSPLEPLFRALLITNPSFDLRAADIVTDRNNIRKLLSFIDPSSNRNGLTPFAINIEVPENTAIFCRQDTQTTEFIRPGDHRGFGHNFEKAYTKSQVSGSTGHHRIISYRFGGLNLIVRHETDGYAVTTTPLASSRTQGPDGSLGDALASLSLCPIPNSPSATIAGSKLTIRREGEVVPLESTLEIKTKTIRKPIEIREVAPQLWVSQTPKLVRAYHNNGLFQPPPEVEDVAGAIIRWEEENQKSLAKLAALLTRVISVAKELGGKVVMNYDDKGDRLVFCKDDGKKMLPDDLYSRWDGTPVGISVIKPETTTPAVKADADPGGAPTQTTTTPADIPFVDIIAHGVQNGFRHFFRRMPCDLADYNVLCTSLTRLSVDVTKQRGLQGVVMDLKTGDDDYDPEERRRIKGSKDTARDAAFMLLYLFLVGEFASPVRDAAVAYNAVQYVVSHRRKFKYRTRKMIREAFESKFAVTYKQRAGLDKWPITPPQDGGRDSEGTTEEEMLDYGFDSDWSD